MVEVGTAAPHDEAIRRLAGRWLARVAADEGTRRAGGDFACSPAGLWLALTAVAGGAAGATAAELRGLLGVAGQDAAAAATAVARRLGRCDALSAVTGVWARTPLYRAYRESLPDIGFGQLGPEAAAELDRWVRAASGGMVERLPVTLSPDVLLVLVNVLAFRARWESPFAPAATRPAPFTDAGGQRHEVPTMRTFLSPADAWRVAGDGGPVDVAQLRCAVGAGEGRPAVVRCVLGAPGAPAASVLPAAWAAPGARAGVVADRVRVLLPRLTLRSRLAVLPHLSALGVRLATSELADFSALSPEPLSVGEVAQECVVALAEEGVRAAAVTVVPMAAGAAPRPARVHELAFDRPFGVVVLDGEGSVPLFTAWQATAPAGA
ncbi:serpin family protein [Streptomyces hainanensis]|uniref:Serine protease n=1 Tax=Streptomyces hainanensis TaxID=402648 RepID=A0A4R4SUX3_9ACTN|nr:serpin family protein [Streptomyces hainanensis]TDC66122.1 serine protease [Streptomyces hainanensis]